MSDIFSEMPRHLKMEELQDKLEELMKMDTINLDTEALRQTKLFFEVQRLYITESNALRWLLKLQLKMKLHRRQYYLGQLHASVYDKEPLNPRPLKTEVDMYLKADDVILEVNDMVADSEARVKLCEDSLKRVKDRGFDIKNAIEWRKAVEQI